MIEQAASKQAASKQAASSKQTSSKSTSSESAPQVVAVDHPVLKSCTISLENYVLQPVVNKIPLGLLVRPTVEHALYYW
jgi:hypothetical protein